MEKPSKKEYPDYYHIITEPIDMKTIESNIRNDRVSLRRGGCDDDDDDGGEGDDDDSDDFEEDKETSSQNPLT